MTVQRREFLNRWLVNFGTLMIFWVLFSYTDFLGLEGALKERSQEIVDRFIAPFYNRVYVSEIFKPKSRAEIEIRAQDKIAVVLLTDQTAKELHTHHPMPFDLHAQILRQILLENPAAIFVDLDFRTKREGQEFEMLVGPFDDLENKIPVLFAGGRREDIERMPEALKGYGTIVAWESEANQYPLLIPSGKPLETDSPTAAMSLFRQLCLAPVAGKRWAGCPKDVDTGPEFYKESLALRWGATAPRRQQVIWSVAGCPLPWNASFLQRAKVAVISSLSSIFAGFAGDIEQKTGDRNPCFYHLAIPAERLATERVKAAIEDEERDLGDDAPPLLKGRVVFYGAMVTGVHDLARSPAHGLVPGVFAHAMAFDNLLTYGAGYIKGNDAEGTGHFFNALFSPELILWAGMSIFLAARYARGTRPVLPIALGEWILGGFVAGWRTLRRLWLAILALPPLARHLGHWVILVAQYLLRRLIRQPTGIFRVEPCPAKPRRRVQVLFGLFEQGDLTLFVLILLIFFGLNELWFRRQVTDWLGLALLYLLATHVGHVAGKR